MYGILLILEKLRKEGTPVADLFLEKVFFSIKSENLISEFLAITTLAGSSTTLLGSPIYNKL